MKNYIGCCVNLNGRKIEDMVDDSQSITRRTFIKHVGLDQLRELEQGLGYVLHPSQGLTMASDFMVGYHKSKYGGKPCVYISHSAIEYVFV